MKPYTQFVLLSLLILWGCGKSSQNQISEEESTNVSEMANEKEDSIQDLLDNVWLVMLKLPSENNPAFISPPCGDGPSVSFPSPSILRFQISQEAIDYSVESISIADDKITMNYKLNDGALQSMSIEKNDDPPFVSYKVNLAEDSNDLIKGFYPDSIATINQRVFSMIKREDGWRDQLNQLQRLLELPCSDMD